MSRAGFGGGSCLRAAKVQEKFQRWKMETPFTWIGGCVVSLWTWSWVHRERCRGCCVGLEKTDAVVFLELYQRWNRSSVCVWFTYEIVSRKLQLVLLAGRFNLIHGQGPEVWCRGFPLLDTAVPPWATMLRGKERTSAVDASSSHGNQTSSKNVRWVRRRSFILPRFFPRIKDADRVGKLMTSEAWLDDPVSRLLAPKAGLSTSGWAFRR